MRKKRLIINTIVAIINQIITFVCGFILPRQILLAFGSETNGLVASITQFLGVITFLDMGIGTVVQSSLYKPLANKNNEDINGIIYEAKNFFSTIAKILIIYTILLMIFYPMIIKNQQSHWQTSFLIFAISLSIITQYFFGIISQLLLNADQRNYINLGSQAIITIINTIVCIIVIKSGASIIVVKLISAVVLLIKPILLYIYVKRKYNLNSKCNKNQNMLKDKWSATAQHIATTIVDKTDIIVLSTFSSLTNVSIYSVYHLVVFGLYQAFLVLTTGIQSFFGDIFAKNENEKFKSSFIFFEFIIHNFISFIFGCSLALIIPFVKIYTLDINDVDYVVPLFSIIIVIAFEFACLRAFYNIVIKAVGHYKQTQKGSINEAIINIAVSIILVYKFGLIGVAIGTLLAMFYRTIYLLNYINKNIINEKNTSVIRLFIIDIIINMFIIIISKIIIINNLTYFDWLVYALKIASISIVGEFIINFIFNNKKFMKIIKNITKVKN